MTRAITTVINETNSSKLGQASPSNILLHLVTDQTIVDILAIACVLGLFAQASGILTISPAVAGSLRGVVLLVSVLVALRLPNIILRKALGETVDTAMSRINRNVEQGVKAGEARLLQMQKDHQSTLSRLENLAGSIPDPP